MKRIDKAAWPRTELFDFFSAVSHPFYSVTFRVDVTNLHAYVRKHHLSFYYALGWLVTKAVNSVEISAMSSGTAKSICWTSVSPA